ncbi:MAG: RDD family protein [Carboxylicivirga sp.]|jgi:uncharacterized RDD family membrane protein YckC|nr:RDD family protein [Carboxylicivirga sp.]
METNYGSLIDRIKALTIDSVVIMALGLITAISFSQFENIPDYIRGVAFVFVFLLYDPIFTSLFGGTIGHLLIGLRVKRDKDHSKKIIFPAAILRFIIKIFLGLISLLTVTGNKKNKSIHDSVVSSVVIKL